MDDEIQSKPFEILPLRSENSIPPKELLGDDLISYNPESGKKRSRFEIADLIAQTMLDETVIFDLKNDEPIDITSDGSLRSNFLPDSFGRAFMRETGDEYFSDRKISVPRVAQQRRRIIEKDKRPIQVLRNSAPLRALTQIARSDFWSTVAPVIARREEFRVDTEEPGRRNRLLTPLFAGIAKANPELLDAAIDVEQDLRNSAIVENLRRGPQRADEVIIGGGVHAAIYTSEGTDSGDTTLVMESRKRTGGIFGIAERATFRLNSRTRAKKLSKVGKPGKPGSLNDLGNGVLQPSDLTGDVYQPNDEIARAIRTNLTLQADTLTDATVIGFENVFSPDSEKPGRMGVQFKRSTSGEEFTLYTDRLLIASGAGMERSFGSIEFTDVKSKQIFDEEIDKAERGEKSLVYTHDTLNRRIGNPSVQFPLQEFSGKRIGITGKGDSSKTDIELETGSAPYNEGSVRQLDAIGEILWYGQLLGTKEDYLYESRVRYSDIGLEMPRKDRPEYIARVQGAPALRKVTARRTKDGRIEINGDILDALVLDTGYINTSDSLLSDFAVSKEIPIDIEPLDAVKIASLLKSGGTVDFKAGSTYDKISVFAENNVDEEQIKTTLTLATGQNVIRMLTIQELEALCQTDFVESVSVVMSAENVSKFEVLTPENLPTSKKAFRKFEVENEGIIATNGKSVFRIKVIRDIYDDQVIVCQTLRRDINYVDDIRTSIDSYYDAASLLSFFNRNPDSEWQIYTQSYLPDISNDNLQQRKEGKATDIEDLCSGMVFSLGVTTYSVINYNPDTGQALIVKVNNKNTSKVYEVDAIELLAKVRRAKNISFYKNPYTKQSAKKQESVRPKLQKEDVIDPDTGNIIGRKVVGAEIYYIGPAAQVELTPEEIEEYGGIFENTQAIFATGERTRRLKQLLGKVKRSYLYNRQKDVLVKPVIEPTTVVTESLQQKVTPITTVTDTDLERISYTADIPQLMQLALSEVFNTVGIPEAVPVDEQRILFTIESTDDGTGALQLRHTIGSEVILTSLTANQRVAAYARELLKRTAIANPGTEVAIGIDVAVTPFGYNAAATTIEALTYPEYISSEASERQRTLQGSRKRRAAILAAKLANA